ncbi:brp/Blh family beta-carotene 15,15'-monooxygenase domain protein [Clostridioides difficile 6042]|nr:brp/Blh family beta-carotene 15,15'-monooxygenase domain protein [Clostridioides difficile 6042]
MKGVFFMVSRQELKRVSKAQLSGNWGICAISMAVYIALIVLISIVITF